MKRLLIILSFLPLFSLSQGPTANFTATSSCYGDCTYFTDYASQADVLIYFVDYKSQSKWKNKEKMHLFY